ncbi:MAG: hypothetical protein AAF585_26915, partial [Verrucomicrobiota bacterium]
GSFALSSCTESALSEWRASADMVASVGNGGALTENTMEPGEQTEVEEVDSNPDEAQLAKLESIAPSVEIESNEGTVTLWLIDAPSKQRVQRLMEKASQSLSAQFSEDKQWMVVSDLAFSDLQTVHLFKRSGATSYEKIDRDAFTGVIWDQFAANKIEASQMVIKYRTTFTSWGDNAINLKLAALPRGADWIEADYTVDLAGL